MKSKYSAERRKKSKMKMTMMYDFITFEDVGNDDNGDIGSAQTTTSSFSLSFKKISWKWIQASSIEYVSKGLAASRSNFSSQFLIVMKSFSAPFLAIIRVGAKPQHYYTRSLFLLQLVSLVSAHVLTSCQKQNETFSCFWLIPTFISLRRNSFLLRVNRIVSFNLVISYVNIFLFRVSPV